MNSKDVHAGNPAEPNLELDRDDLEAVYDRLRSLRDQVEARLHDGYDRQTIAERDAPVLIVYDSRGGFDYR